MRPRWRVAAVMVPFGVLMAVYLYWLLPTVRNIYLWNTTGSIHCGQSWVYQTNGCSRFVPALAVVQIVLIAVILAAIVVVAALWCLRPVRAMAEMVERFGPTSLSLRVSAGSGRDETAQLGRAVDAVLARLAAGYEAQRRFASSASHELRTPLATQRALVEVSLADPLTDDQRELLARQLIATNDRNERLVDGLLTLAETERGLLVRDDIRLDQLAASVVAGYREPAARADLHLNVSVSPVTVRGERSLLERLISNLVGNGVKYNRPGGSVTVRVDPSLGGVEVCNTGPVVDPEQVDGLFEPFRRLSGERLEHGNGAGLGLTIVRSIVAAHGAVVEASALPAGGLRIAVRFAAR